MTYEFDYSPEQLERIELLASTIEGMAHQMAVVDYLGRCDGDGLIVDGSPVERRFGTRGMLHVGIYKLNAIRLNRMAREKK